MNKEINLQELKRIQLDLLDVFCEYCDTNNLTYYLTYGTLIGAVRHNGYIPWDDDIDVMMPRMDYEKFLLGFNQFPVANDVKAVSHEIDPHYYLAFAKLINTSTTMQEEVSIDYKIGVYIDIFPLDNLADDYETAKKRIRKAFRYNELMLFKNLTINSKRTWYKNAIIRVGRVISVFWSRDKLIKALNQFGIHSEDGCYTRYIGTVTGISAGDESRVFESEWFKKIVKVTFEGRKYNAPAGYDAFLKKLYGDYMKLPPLNEQITHHVYKAWYN